MSPSPFLVLLLAAAQESPAPSPHPAADSPPRSALHWADVDGDGRQDVLAVGPGGVPRLLLQLAGGHFLDASGAVGLVDLGPVSSAAFGDADGDGRPDLYLASRRGPGRLLLQGTGGVFVDATLSSGLPPEPGHVHARFDDLDADGRLDLLLLGAGSERVFRNLGEARFAELDLGPLARGEHADGASAASSSSAPGAPGPLRVMPTVPSQTLGAVQHFFCLDSLTDQETGLCLQASSEPTMGMLFPMSVELNVDANGRVGVGTTSPAEELDVAGDVRAQGRLISAATTGPPLSVASSQLVADLNADRLDGLEATAFRLVADPIGAADLAAGAVDSAAILDGTVTQSDLAPNAVGVAEIQPNAVGTSEIAANAVTASEIAANAVGASEIAAGAVDSAAILDGTVAQADLAWDSVGSAQIATGAVGSLEISSDSVGASEIAAGAVGASEIATGAVRSSEIQNGTIQDVDVSSSAAIAGTKIDPDFGNQDVTTTGAGHFFNATSGSNTFGLSATQSSGPTEGYLAVTGAVDFQGVQSADWSNLDIGAAGIATDFSTSDNYGVLGHSSGVGVRGEYSGAPATNYGELGSVTAGVRAEGSFRAIVATGGNTGIFASGGTYSADLSGNARVLGKLEVEEDGTQILDVQRTNAAGSSTDIVQIADHLQASLASQYIECEASDVDFRVDRDGDVFADGSFFPGGADYAEMIRVSTGALSVEPGDVLVVDPLGERAVKLSAAPYSRLVAGVYSTKPGILGSEREWDEPDPAGGAEHVALKRGDMAERHDEVPMAMVGIVPCKVTGQNGPIEPGDLLVTSSLPGHAMVDNSAPNGTVLGKALEPFDGAAGVIRVLVTLQ